MGENKLITEDTNDYTCVVRRWDADPADIAGNLILLGTGREKMGGDK